ncbi:MAG: type III pantothenate kinase, partial [Bacteroidota bacterium]
KKKTLNSLVIDAGNSLIKAALFENDQIIAKYSSKGSTPKGFSSFLAELPSRPSNAILSSVRKDSSELEHELNHFGINNVLNLRSGLKLPVRIHYKTPETLGADRIANASMAVVLVPAGNAMVIDIGTCIKYDLVATEKTYLGGAISPGIKIRYKGLSAYTGRLPYFKNLKEEFPELVGSSTEGSIRSGVEHGMLCEMNGMLQSFEKSYPGLALILTGGDHLRFKDKLEKKPIFADADLTLKGLHEILKINAFEK